MKRILSAVIVILLVFALCSCGGQPESEAVPEYQLDAETENFAGMEISFFGDTDLFFRYEAHSPAYDALVKRIIYSMGFLSISEYEEQRTKDISQSDEGRNDGG